MKTALKKSFVLIGIALFFVLTAWAEQKIWAWDKNVPEKDNYYIKVPAILEDGGDA